MSRKKRTLAHRNLYVDPIYQSTLVTRFINCMMWDGKKTVSQSIFYKALESLGTKVDVSPFEAFQKALSNVKPDVEVRSRRVGGASYQVPVEVSLRRQETLAIRWILNAARDKKGLAMYKRLSAELLDAFNGTGNSIRRKEEVRRMADSNKVFAHFVN